MDLTSDEYVSLSSNKTHAVARHAQQQDMAQHLAVTFLHKTRTLNRIQVN